jgi:hypothetical protein
MENDFVISLIAGTTIASSLYIWNNTTFTSTQKISLLICVFFPPAQWFGLIIILAYNSYFERNSIEKVEERKVNEANAKLNLTISNLNELKEKGILTNEEYNVKVKNVEAQKIQYDIKTSTEYKQLKNLIEIGILTTEEFESKIKFLEKKLESGEILKNQKKTDTIVYVYALILVIIVSIIIIFSQLSE